MFDFEMCFAPQRRALFRHRLAIERLKCYMNCLACYKLIQYLPRWLEIRLMTGLSFSKPSMICQRLRLMCWSLWKWKSTLQPLVVTPQFCLRPLVGFSWCSQLLSGAKWCLVYHNGVGWPILQPGPGRMQHGAYFRVLVPPPLNHVNTLHAIQVIEQVVQLSASLPSRAPGFSDTPGDAVSWTTKNTCRFRFECCYSLVFWGSFHSVTWQKTIPEAEQSEHVKALSLSLVRICTVLVVVFGCIFPDFYFFANHFQIADLHFKYQRSPEGLKQVLSTSISLYSILHYTYNVPPQTIAQLVSPYL